MSILNSNPNELINEYSSSLSGINDDTAVKNKQAYGENKLDPPKKITMLSRFVAQFKNLMVIILLISAVISTVIALCTKTYSDLFEGGLIFIIVILNAVIGVMQERRADQAIALLHKKTEPFAKVYRNGKLVKIPTEEVVVGDIVSIKAGDYIPADIRLIEANNLKCDESTLTGESHAVFKNADVLLKDETPIAEQENMCFSGTSCTYGNAKGIVVRVGKQTEMGKIAKLLSSSVKEKTPLEKNIDKIGKFLTYGILAIVAVVFLVEIIFAKNISFMDSFLIAVALAVAAIPESLTAVITIVMALGVERLAKKQAIVKTLSSVETLGCCNVICSDKTGTLTQNKMTVKHIFINNKLSNDFKNDNKTAEIFYQALTLCNNAQEDDKGNIIGDATETSLFALAKQNSSFDSFKTYQRLHEFPFDSTRKIMSTINKTPKGNKMYSKGAYDYLINRCTKVMIDGKAVKLTSELRASIDNAVSSLTKNAERVLAITEKDSTASTLKNETEDNLTFIGLVGIIDPPRAEAKDAIAKCHKAGLKPVMITGDHPDTAFAIAKELNIAQNRSQVITGLELDALSTKDLAKEIEKYTVFARVSPEHKVKIVKAFKKSGKIVAMTGDGVNDAPSLKGADIGVCMGITGTDVTKSVADLIITDDNYSTIIVAIKQGRTIYSNIQKIIQFLLSTNAVEVLGIFVATIVMRDSVFLLPSQILFINLVTDSFPAFALGMEKPEKGIMDVPPRDPKQTLFSGRVGTGILYQSFVQTLLVLVVFVVGVNIYDNAVASTMVFLIICLMQIIHAVNCKTLDSIFKMNIFNNLSFNLSFLGLFALIMFVAFVPFMQVAFSIVPLNGIQWLIVTLSSISIIPLVEICKLIVNTYYKRKGLIVSNNAPQTKKLNIFKKKQSARN